MLSHPLPRLAALSIVLLSLVTLGGAKLSPSGAAAAQDNLIVHEWGTFTSVADGEGYALEWRPLSFESDLPSFVYSIDKGASWRGLRYPSKSATSVTVRMETPVLYFYAKEETAVSVKVNFPGGKITEWYPQARALGRSIDWGQFRILPGANVELPKDGLENHYYPARETDAATVEVRVNERTEHEKFLFYRGVGDFGLPLSVRLRDNKVAIATTRGGNVGKVILFENRGGKIGYVIREAQSNEMLLDRPALAGHFNDLRREMKAMLISHGLYEKEADAMLNTWRDSWFEEGLRVFYIMPRQTADAILPITITPQPTALVRVLVGRTELITPEMEKNIIEQAAKLEDPSASVREAALKEIKKYGRFTEPLLNLVLRHTTDQQTLIRVGRLMEEMRQQARRLN